MKVYVSSGGGVRIGATFGAVWKGEQIGAFQASDFDCFAGTSAGALDAALTANGWTGVDKYHLFMHTDFSKFFKPFFMPYAVREALALQWPISLTKLHDFYSSLCKPNKIGPALRFTPNLYINTVDTAKNEQVIYINNGGNTIPWDRKDDDLGSYRLCTDLATALVESSALPGLRATNPYSMDGGIAENPLLSIFPDDAEMTVIQLGYPGRTDRKNIIQDLMYAYDFKAYLAAQYELDRFKNLRLIKPYVYDIPSSAFNLSDAEKLSVFNRGANNSIAQWRYKKENPRQ